MWLFSEGDLRKLELRRTSAQPRISVVVGADRMFVRVNLGHYSPSFQCEPHQRATTVL
jgi:hypothetical protein